MKKTTLISKYSKRILYVFFLFFLGKNFLYAQKVGINTTTPTNDLHIISTADPVRLAGMQTGSDADSIVTINSTGLLKRRNTNTLFNSFAWRLIGNSGTNPTTNFLGTTDNVPFNIRVNNIRSGYFSENHLFLGYDAGRLNTSAESSFIGVESGYSNTSGEYNVGLGKKSLRLNTTGGYNTGLGTSALASNTTGSYNTAVGTASLLLNTTGANNTALGVYALTNNTIGTNNTALGLNTLSFNTSGSYNTGVGQNSLYNNTTGAYNTAVGNYSSAFNTTGENNTSMGYAASSWNTSGSRNSTYGYYAGYSASGSIYNDNSYFGYFAGGANTSGSNNTGFGSEALKVVTTGSNNTAFGYRAGVANITGANNTFLGYGADGTSFALTNATAIGYNAKVATNNSLVLGGTGADLVNVGIGNTSPSNTLHLTPSAGTDPLRVENIRSGSTADSILTTTSTGLVKKITIAALSTRLGSNFWSLTGNTGTVDGTNFIGTTDNIPFNIRVNNNKAGRIDNTNLNTFFGYKTGEINTGTNNTFIGHRSGVLNTTGATNVALGANSLSLNTTGSDNAALGETALYNNTTGHDNVAVGQDAMRKNTTGNFNTAVGESSLEENTTGGYHFVGGQEAMQFNTTGANSTAIGYRAAYTNVTGNNLIAIGNQAGFSNTASDNHFVGYQAGYSNTTGLTNTFEGFQAGYSNTTANANTSLGYQALRNNVTSTGNTAIGTNALTNTTAGSNTAVGANTLTLNTTGSLNTAVGEGALYANTTGTGNTAIGQTTLFANTTGTANTALGFGALTANTTGTANTALARGALASNISGINNVAVGYHSAYNTTNGNRNTTVGYYSAYSMLTANDNTHFGYNAGTLTTTGSNNTSLGSDVLSNTTTGSNQVAIGYQAGKTNITGSNNTFVGYGADVTAAALTNAAAIGYNAKVATNNSLVLGGTGADLVNVGIGNTSPSNTLHITPSAGTDPLRVENIRSGSTADSILTTTSTGLVKKITIAALSNRLGFNFWSLTGNTGTSSGTNFVGTTDAQALILKSNNIEGLRVATNGYVGVNTVAPTGVLHATSSSAANSVLLERTHTIAATASVNLRLLGNYAAGTTPAHTSGTGISFRMKDNVQAETPEAAIRLLHGSAVGKGHLEFITSDDVNGSANVRMHINEGGKVGIGVTNPGKILVLRDNDVSFAPTTAQLLTGYAANPVTSTLINSVEFSEITTGTVGMSIDHYDGGAALAGGTSNNRLDISAINSGTRAAVATFTNNGNFGVGTATPNTKADIDGAVAIRSSSTAVTVDNQAITVGNRSYIKLTGDATPSSRTVTLSAGLSDGQILIISVIGTGINGIELADSGNLNLSGLMQLDNGDTIQLIWDGTSWNEITRSSN